mgnify:CR=1 FL=1
MDLNCGEPNFRKFIKYKKYYANDIFTPEDTTGIEFRKCRDDEVDIKADVIVLFGYGGGEFTGQPMESSTAGETVIRLSEKYKPEFIVLEMAWKWEKDFKIMTDLTNRLKDYKILFSERCNIEPVEHYHDKRYIRIFKLPTGA